MNKQGAYRAGHFYSPIPDNEDVLSYTKSRRREEITLPDIKINKESQFNILQEYSKLYDQLPFPEKQSEGFRYYYKNDFYSYSDAIFLHCFLRKNKPKRIIEVGSGFSSAVMLDTIDKFYSRRPEITFIEPYPDRLKSLLEPHDNNQINIIEKKIQEVSLELFYSLESDDLLFIDSSHVVKCGSDLQLLLFDILPFLSPGIFVHFHDVFYPFEYPNEWLNKGWYWNEIYFLPYFFLLIVNGAFIFLMIM